MSAFWIILAAALVAIPCAILGSFLVLKKMVMVGDAISHAVLPGIVIAFIFVHRLDSIYLLVGATLTGLITTFLIELAHKKVRIQEDASIGIVFTLLFSIGLILISVYTKNTDLDLDCVLYGEIINVPFNVWITDDGTNMGPLAIWTLGGVSLLVILFVWIGYKSLLISTFDPIYASAIGIKTTYWQYLLMAMVSLVTVAAFESVGAILVVALLVIPAATAYLLTNNLLVMIGLASAFGIFGSIGGYYLAGIMNASTSGSIVTVCGIFFFLALLLSPIRRILLTRLNKTSLS